MIKPLTFKYFFMLDHQQTIKRVLGLTNIKEIAAGSNHSIAINDQGIWTWGKADSFNLGVQVSQSIVSQPIFLQVSVDKACASLQHTFAWKNNEVYCWGSNKDYKLGLQEPKQYPLTKSQIFVEAIQAGMQLENICCGDSHSLAVFKLEEEDQISYQIFAWGESKGYQLGLEAEGAVSEPILIQFDQQVKAIQSRNQYNFIVTYEGNCYSWGTNLFGRLGFSNEIKNQKFPSKIKSLTNIKSVSMGKYHCIALSDQMEGYSWGHGLHGQLGLGQILSETTPTRIPLNLKLVKSACGEYHSIVMTQNGQIMSCGTNSYLALGHNEVDNKKRCKIFYKINTQGISIANFVVGNRHNLILSSEGNVYSWGCNKYGQLGCQQQMEVQTKRELFKNSAQFPKQKQGENSKLKVAINPFLEFRENVSELNQQIYSEKKKENQRISKLQDWKNRYQKFKLQKEQQQKLFMLELNQILNNSFSQ